MKFTALLASALTVVSAGAAFAGNLVAAPEIDVLSGVAAVAVVGAAVALIRERNKH
jgi:uncharacterized protein YccT (UPF0319 family)